MKVTKTEVRLPLSATAWRIHDDEFDMLVYDEDGTEHHARAKAGNFTFVFRGVRVLFEEDRVRVQSEHGNPLYAEPRDSGFDVRARGVKRTKKAK